MNIETGGSMLSLFCRSTGLVRRRSYRSAGKQAPVVANTTLTVCRLFGRSLYVDACVWADMSDAS